jgi:hypothetical protein
MLTGQTFCHHCGTEILEFYEIFDHVTCEAPKPLESEPDARALDRRVAWQVKKHLSRLEGKVFGRQR